MRERQTGAKELYTHHPPSRPVTIPFPEFQLPARICFASLATRRAAGPAGRVPPGPAESTVQRKLRSPLSGETGGAGDPVGRYQGRPPLDQVRALDHGDRQSTEDATFSRLQGIGETQVGGGKSGST